MDEASHGEQNCPRSLILDSERCSTSFEQTTKEEVPSIGVHSLEIERLTPAPIDPGYAGPNSGIIGRNTASKGNSSRQEWKGKKVASQVGSRSYFLRSSSNGVRVLRPRSIGTSKTSPAASSKSSPIMPERRKSRREKRKLKEVLSNDEYSRTRKSVRYLLARINFEQGLIDAYSGEGWKGQSQEKVKPEKELKRAEDEIVRRKLRIRDLFQHLQTLCEEGRIHESLFDSEGKIYSEDIFCAKCGSKDVPPDNDIILCDGICNRGFHQMCLVPPLLKEQIPPGDEGWLCPGCECKAFCVDLVNDYLGTDLLIEDGWEKVFAEAAALASGDKQYDDLGLPSDDSEDNDYNPDGPDIDDEAQNSSSSSEESDMTSGSSDSESSSSDDEASSLDEGSGSSLPGPFLSADLSLNGSEGRSNQKKPRMNSELLSILEPESNGKVVSPLPGKRNRERLDYKKLHDEDYGNVSSDSSDDEDWVAMDTSKRKKSGGVGRGTRLPTKHCTLSPGSLKIYESIPSLPETQILLQKPNSETIQVGSSLTHNIPGNSQIQVHGVSASGVKSHVGGGEHISSRNGPVTPLSKRFGRLVTQSLHNSFKENMYPTKETRAKLAEELGITFKQVSKWFENARVALRNAKLLPPGKTVSPSVSHPMPSMACQMPTTSGGMEEKPNETGGEEPEQRRETCGEINSLSSLTRLDQRDGGVPEELLETNASLVEASAKNSQRVRTPQKASQENNEISAFFQPRLVRLLTNWLFSIESFDLWFGLTEMLGRLSPVEAVSFRLVWLLKLLVNLGPLVLIVVIV
ncbi:hypothetical protein AMTR_s00001p00272780 [Amborella trichopoda]|uniref:Homeobox domain-containing protein n=1 Tax=Amborella trichopoda TaxID=13333 RepID=W1NN25_AMBTC|nr:hypothetical protein AMTR_s00001p00272780 [Amborella trichopoda]